MCEGYGVTVSTTPLSDVDIFSDDVLTDPYPVYAELRDTGPAVYLQRYDCWALPRYAQVKAALRDHQRFSSHDAVGYEPSLAHLRKGSVIAVDPPEHDTLRHVLAESVAPRALKRLHADIERRASELVDSLVERGSFDAVTDLAEVFPLSVVADLIGIPEYARTAALRYADAAFNTFGPLNARTQAALPVATSLFDELTTAMARENLRPGSWGHSLYEAADRGLIRQDQVVALLRAYLTAAMDTTISSVSNAIWLLAEHPEAWRALKANPSLLRSAFEEVVRIESPVQAFFRRTTTDVDIEGIHIPADTRVVILYGSANRDPRKWPDPDRFIVDRNPTDHVGFGYGVHACVGQGLARLEGHALLSALLDRVDSIHLDGPPVRRLNNVIRGLSSLPVSVVPRSRS